jgi:hypothetical protein
MLLLASGSLGGHILHSKVPRLLLVLLPLHLLLLLLAWLLQ